MSGPGIDIKAFRVVAALAEELNFKRAAIKLGIGQSAVSKTLQTVERLLGHPLFFRNGRRVRILPAGERFVDEGRISLVHHGRAIELAKRANEHTDLPIYVGKSPYTDPYLLSHLFSLRLPRFPRLKITLTSKLTPHLSHDLLNGILDLAFLTGMPETAQLSSTVVATQQFFVAMLKDSKLAKRKQVERDDLAGHSCILFERHVNPHLYDALVNETKPASLPGTQLHHFMTAEEASQYVLTGLGAAVLSQNSAWRIARNGITMRPLNIETVVETRLACRTDADARVVGAFQRGFVKRLQASRPGPQSKLRLNGTVA
jgi:DNA-binding transcriptional LysR family regulator